MFTHKAPRLTSPILWGIVALSLFLLPTAVLAADSWITPDGHEETDFDAEENAYDDDLDTYAYDWVADGDTSPWIILTYSYTIECTKVRGYFSRGSPSCSDIEVDVYYDDAWTNIYDDEFDVGQWEEYPIGSTEYVTKVRMRFKDDGSLYGSSIWVREVDFWGDTIYPYAIVLLPAADTNIVGTDHTINATVTDQFDDPIASVSVTWELTGDGFIKTSDSQTDVNGLAQAVISSNVTGNSTVQCSVDGYDLYDICTKEWLPEPPAPAYASFPVWVVVLLVALLVASLYTQSLFLGISGVILCIAGYGWLAAEGTDDITVWGGAAFFLIVIAWLILTIIWRHRHGTS